LAVASTPGSDIVSLNQESGIQPGDLLVLDPAGAGREEIPVDSVLSIGKRISIRVAASAKETTLLIRDATGFVTGQQVTLEGDGHTVFSTLQGIVDRSATFTQLAADAAVGSTRLALQSVGGFSVGDRILIEEGDISEVVTVLGVDAGARVLDITTSLPGLPAQGLRSKPKFT